MSKLPFHYGLQLRIYPSCEQMRIIHRNIDAGRWYYNQLVAWGRLRLPKTEGNFPVFDAMRQRCDELMNPRLKEWKETHLWLNNEDRDSLTFDNAKKAYQAAWNLCKKVKSAGRPNFHKAATHIINMKNGHILWIAEGKKKQVDFNDKVVGEIRKDEQKRLIAEGDLEAAKLLKHSKYIVTSSRETLARKDREAKEGKVLRKKGEVFPVSEVKRKDIGYLERYESILQKNRLLFTADLIKEQLKEAYASRNEARMQEFITKILDLCANSGNKHMAWFWRLLVRHFDGITSHATYHISAGKIEGINNKIKTLRRQAYGYPDDEYFFLKLIDMSRH